MKRSPVWLRTDSFHQHHWSSLIIICLQKRAAHLLFLAISINGARWNLVTYTNRNQDYSYRARIKLPWSTTKGSAEAPLNGLQTAVKYVKWCWGTAGANFERTRRTFRSPGDFDCGGKAGVLAHCWLLCYVMCFIIQLSLLLACVSTQETTYRVGRSGNEIWKPPWS